MDAQSLTLPQKGFTKAERAWLAQLVEAIKTVQAVAGNNTTVSNSEAGQVINAEDCSPCES